MFYLVTYPLRCANPVDPNQVIFHPVWVDNRVQYPSHFKRFEAQMFAFAEDDNNLKEQVSPWSRTTTFQCLDCIAIALQNVSSYSQESFIVQIFVHCNVVICDLKKRETGACNRRCPRPENKLKGMQQVQTFPADITVF